ncbi:MAG: FitA-like ribbon-helix-helix domain-containing protein [Pseudomonadota bacterium]
MKALHIRNLPDEVHEALKRLAAASHRSVQEYVRALIEREVRLAKPSPVEAARHWRGKLAGRTLGDTIEDVRADRAR